MTSTKTSHDSFFFLNIYYLKPDKYLSQRTLCKQEKRVIFQSLAIISL